MTRRFTLPLVAAAALVVLSVGAASAEWLASGAGAGSAAADTWVTTLAPSPEVCDSVDNDRNGVVDDNPTDVPPDDGIDVTTPICDGGMSIVVIAPGFCVIDGQSYPEDTINPSDPALVCLPDLANTEWSPVP